MKVEFTVVTMSAAAASYVTSSLSSDLAPSLTTALSQQGIAVTLAEAVAAVVEEADGGVVSTDAYAYDGYGYDAPTYAPTLAPTTEV